MPPRAAPAADPGPPRTSGARRRGLLVIALDGTVITVPDGSAVLTRFSKQAGNHGGTGYPQVRLPALVARGTRTLIDAVFGSATSGETTCAPRVPRSLQPGMILPADRDFAAQELAPYAEVSHLRGRACGRQRVDDHTGRQIPQPRPGPAGGLQCLVDHLEGYELGELTDVARRDAAPGHTGSTGADRLGVQRGSCTVISVGTVLPGSPLLTSAHLRSSPRPGLHGLGA